MSVFSTSGGPQSVVVIGASSPTVVNISMPLAGTEYSYVVPASAKQFLIQTRDGAPLQLSYSVGTSATNYISIPRWCFYCDSDLSAAGVTLYFQSTKASQIAEIVVWT